jgi:hypothetical protein
VSCDITINFILAGVIPEFVAKWISGHGIPPSFLCLSTMDCDLEIAEGEDSTASSCSETGCRPVKPVRMKSRSISLSGNPFVS